MNLLHGPTSQRYLLLAGLRGVDTERPNHLAGSRAPVGEMQPILWHRKMSMQNLVTRKDTTEEANTNPKYRDDKRIKIPVQEFFNEFASLEGIGNRWPLVAGGIILGEEPVALLSTETLKKRVQCDRLKLASFDKLFNIYMGQ